MSNIVPVSPKNALATARHFSISPKTFYKWRNVYREANLRTLESRSSAPKNRRIRQITPEQERRIILLRRMFLRYGKEKLALKYREQYGELVSAWKIQKVIEKYGIYYHPAKNARTQSKRRKATKKKRIAELALKKRTGFLFRLDTVVRYWRDMS